MKNIKVEIVISLIININKLYIEQNINIVQKILEKKPKELKKYIKEGLEI